MGADDAQRGVHPCMPNLGLSTGVTLDDYTELKRIHLLDFRTGIFFGPVDGARHETLRTSEHTNQA